MVFSWLKEKCVLGRMTMSAKRLLRDELEELLVLLQKTKAKMARVEELLREPCPHTDRTKVVPPGPRDNGEHWYVCTQCGAIE